ncbi:hypothetical protein BH23BAC2_BH23BAC2_11240 [soil metagenome]
MYGILAIIGLNEKDREIQSLSKRMKMRYCGDKRNSLVMEQDVAG